MPTEFIDHQGIPHRIRSGLNPPPTPPARTACPLIRRERSSDVWVGPQASHNANLFINVTWGRFFFTGIRLPLGIYDQFRIQTGTGDLNPLITVGVYGANGILAAKSLGHNLGSNDRLYELPLEKELVVPVEDWYYVGFHAAGGQSSTMTIRGITGLVGSSEANTSWTHGGHGGDMFSGRGALGSSFTDWSSYVHPSWNRAPHIQLRLKANKVET